MGEWFKRYVWRMDGRRTENLVPNIMCLGFNRPAVVRTVLQTVLQLIEWLIVDLSPNLKKRRLRPKCFKQESKNIHRKYPPNATLQSQTILRLFQRNELFPIIWQPLVRIWQQSRFGKGLELSRGGSVSNRIAHVFPRCNICQNSNITWEYKRSLYNICHLHISYCSLSISRVVKYPRWWDH